MRFTSFFLAASLSLSSVSGLLITSILPWAQGDTLLVSATVDAAGATEYFTLSTFGAGGAAAVATPTSTKKSSSATASATTTAAVASGEVAAGTILDYSQYASIVAPSLSAAYAATASSSSSSTTSSTPSLLLITSVGAALAGTLFGAGALLL